MTIELHPSFKKAYQERIARNQRLVRKVRERVGIFCENTRHPLLQDHALVGKKHTFRAFSVTGDIRIVYFPVSGDHCVFLDIGTHSQVY